MAVEVIIASKVTARDIVAINATLAEPSNKFVLYNQLDTSTTLNGTSVPVVSLMAPVTVALVAGAATIDLTSLPGTNGATVNGNGLKIQAIKISPHDTNAGVITIKVGASNGYNLNGSAWSETLGPLDAVLIEKNESAPDIDSTHKTFDLSGTGTDAIDLLIFMG